MPSVLTSWKEISRHLGKGVRTVQRWEIELGLPIRRSGGGSRRALFAVPEELDAWARSHPHAPTSAIVDSLNKELASLHAEVSDLRVRLDRVERAHPVPGDLAAAGAISYQTALLLREDLQQTRLALRATIGQSRILRGQSQAVRGQSRTLRFLATSLHNKMPFRPARKSTAPLVPSTASVPWARSG